MRKKAWLSSSVLALLLSGCMTVPNTTACSVAGVVSAGAICAETLTGKTSELTFEQLIDFLEAKPDKDDPDHPGKKIKGHGAAIIQSLNDWAKQKTALELACRDLGKRCKYEVKQLIEQNKNFLELLSRKRSKS